MSSRDTTAGFFALTLIFSWCLQVPGVLARRGLLPGEPDAYLPFAMLGIFGPLAAATYLSLKEGGRDGVKALFKSLLAWRMSPKWYVYALFVPGILLSMILGLANLAGRQGDWYFLPAGPQLVSILVISVAEETGWRGYAFPRLAAKYGAFVGSVILGVFWTFWHIPMFLGMDVPMSLLPVMLLLFVGGSLFYAWLYRGTGGSLLIAVLAHAGAHLNNSHRPLPDDTFPAIAHAVVYAALGVIVMWRAAFELPGASATSQRVAQ